VGVGCICGCVNTKRSYSHTRTNPRLRTPHPHPSEPNNIFPVENYRHKFDLWWIRQRVILHKELIKVFNWYLLCDYFVTGIRFLWRKYVHKIANSIWTFIQDTIQHIVRNLSKHRKHYCYHSSNMKSQIRKHIPSNISRWIHLSLQLTSSSRRCLERYFADNHFSHEEQYSFPCYLCSIDLFCQTIWAVIGITLKVRKDQWWLQQFSV
jgi:hypothetical protein